MSGELNPGEPHPAAHLAMDWVKKIPLPDLMLWLESFASNAIEGNRSSEICQETLSRLLDGKPVSDRYLLGLAWFLRECVESSTKQ